MTAKEAREKANKVNDDKSLHNCLEVMELIRLCVSHGDFEVSPYFHLIDSVKKRLSELGYKIIETPDGRNNVDIIISWKA